MTEKNDFLPISKFIRPGTVRQKTLGGVIHWTAKPMQSASDTRKYWADRENGSNGYGSAHDIVDRDGSVLHCVPSNEIAYHCGATSPIYQGSEQYYTDIARRKWPDFTLDYQHKSPNSILIGIEFEHETWEGFPTTAARASLLLLMIRYSKQYGLKAADWYRHKDIVGYKDCPHWYNLYVEDWSALLADLTKGIS